MARRGRGRPRGSRGRGKGPRRTRIVTPEVLRAEAEQYDPVAPAITDDIETIVVSKRRTFPLLIGRANSAPAKSSDYACWWCFHKFDGVPFYMPTKYLERTREYYVQGNFCSANCVRAYMRRDYSAAREIHIGWLTDILRTVYKLNPYDPNNPLRPAPPRERLRLLGGDMTIEEFRAAGNKTSSRIVQTQYIVEPPPRLTLQSLIIEESFNQREPRQQVRRQQQASGFQGIPVTMKIERSRPVKRARNTIGKFMNITRK